MTERIAATTEDEILGLWDTKNWSAKYISERVGVTASTVYRVLRRRGAPIDPTESRIRKRRTTPEQDEEIVRRYLAGEGAQNIAADFGLKFHISVIQRVREAGHDIRPSGPPMRDIPADVGEEILRLRNEEGLSQEKIGELLGIGQPRISRWLRRNGHRTWEMSRHPRHAGGRVRMSNGYMGVRLLEDDPLFDMAGSGGYVTEHRLVMARALGRPLVKHETVHHINGDRADNRLENLQLRTGAHGKGVRMQCHDCGSHNVEAVPLD